MQTMKVKPWAEGQGDYVLINAEDFDADVHEALDPVDAIAGDGTGEALPAGEDMSGMDAQPARCGRKPKVE